MGVFAAKNNKRHCLALKSNPDVEKQRTPKELHISSLPFAIIPGNHRHDHRLSLEEYLSISFDVATAKHLLSSEGNGCHYCTILICSLG